MGDLELTDIQLLGRYINDDDESIYDFNDNLKIAHISDIYEPKKKGNFEDNFLEYIRNWILNNHIGAVVVDNMTMLYEGNMNNSKNVAPLMKNIKQLSKDTGTTFILIEHTKKTPNNKPLLLNDMNGSKMKAYPVDSIIGIGRSSQDENTRYVKQLKVRSTEIIYSEENVAVYQLEKRNSFLGFTYLGTDSETNHLQAILPFDKKVRDAEILKLHEQGIGNTEISNIISDGYRKISEGRIRAIIKENIK